jgi:ferredoxin-NADP reductase
MPHVLTRDERVPRRKVRAFAAVVTEVVHETPDTVTLVLAAEDRPEYQAGQFLTVDPHQFKAIAGIVAWLEEQKGKREPPRAYSLASAPHERDIAITIKEEPYVKGRTSWPPLLSPLLVHGITPGTRLEVTGFTGPYVLPLDPERKADHVLHLVAGSGVVPNWSILKHALRAHPRLRHTVVFSNKTWGDVIFREPLHALAASHPDRLRVVHTLTREPDPARHGTGVRKGRIGPDLLREVVEDPRACLAYVCGPAVTPEERKAAAARGESCAPRFLENALEALAAIGVPPDRVKRETW